jgi:carboxyl-terminal processing protease
VVVAPIDGSPAQNAGVRAGDAILKVDGAGLDGLTGDAARDKVRGKKGTEVVLTIQRGTAAPFDVKIVRDVIAQKEVIAKDLANGTIGYIRVTGFSDNAATEFHAALAADVKAGKTKVILDLRGNPGGYVTAAQSIASEFVSSGHIFWEQTADGTQTPTDAKAGGLATDPGIKLVILVDRGSASASEIVAGALEELHRGTLVGETTFGKGTVQQWIELPNTGALKLTIARWLTPDKHWIHHVGIVPDVSVAIPATPVANQDPALDKAVEVLTKGTAMAPVAVAPLPGSRAEIRPAA